MTKQEALTIAESAPEPVQTLLEEIIERTFKASPKKASKKAAAEKAAAEENAK